MKATVCLAPVLATLSIHVSTGSDDGRLRRPLVVMVEPTEDRKPDDLSTDLRDGPRGCAGRVKWKNCFRHASDSCLAGHPESSAPIL